jgi:hypothetical protein
MRSAAVVLVLVASGCAGGGGETVVVTRTVEVTTTVEAAPVAPPIPTVEGALDPDDVSGRLDLHEVVARRDGDLLHVSISTYDAWSDSVLAGPSPVDAGPERLTLVYDVDEDGQSDYVSQVIAASGGLFVSITGTDRAFEPVPARRSGPTTVTFTHPVDVFFRSAADAAREIQVAAWSRFDGTVDHAPDSAWLAVAYDE